MFGQYLMWTDCNRSCTFCSQQNIRGNLTLDDKKLRIMRATQSMSVDCNGYDRLGICGGELFADKGLHREWRCLAGVMQEVPAVDILITSHLIGEMSELARFVEMLDKNVLICTSWDAVGRFNSAEEEAQWRTNLDMFHDMGVKLCCTSLMTEELVHSEPNVPDWVYRTLNEPFVDYHWYYRNPEINDESDYHNILLRDMWHTHLPKRNDALKWLEAHRDYAEHYVEEDTHASDVYEFEDGRFVRTLHDRYNKLKSPCGHQLSTKCYSDSPKCLKCDIEAILQ